MYGGRGLRGVLVVAWWLFSCVCVGAVGDDDGDSYDDDDDDDKDTGDK